MRNSTKILSSIVLGALLASAASVTMAGDRGDRGDHGDRGGGGHFDARYHHDRYYPSRGAVVGRPPGAGAFVNHSGGRYWYGGGAWYAPRGPRWVVVGPPLGLYVSVLPPYYTTVWFGGVPYYYANDVYYRRREVDNAYEVVEPPTDAGASAVEVVPNELFTYPRSGQTADQQAKDRYECHRWAADQTGFDPTRSLGGVEAGSARTKRAEYLRAMTACLEGRGYSVK